MARLFARAEWRLAAAATLAGLLTGLLVLLLWARAPGAGDSRGLMLLADSLLKRSSAPAEALHGRVIRRLAARPVPQRPLRGTLSLRGRNVVWREPATGRLFAYAPAVTASIDAGAANRLDIVLGSVVLEQPRLELRSDGSHWNYESPLARLLAEDRVKGERQVTFRIVALRLVGGTAHVVMPGRDFTLGGIEARLANVELAAPGLPAPRMGVVSASAELQLAGRERAWTLTAERGQLSFPTATTQFSLGAVTVAGTRLENVRGVWDPAAPGYGVTATGTVPGVDLARVQFLSPERLPKEGTASFGFDVAPRPGDGTAIRIRDLEVISGASRASGFLAAEVFPGGVSVERVALRLNDVEVGLLEPFTGPLPYHGTLTGTVEGPGGGIRIDITGRLTTDSVAERFTARVTGVASVTRSGLGLEDVRAELTRVPLGALRALAPGLPLAGYATGSVSLTGMPRKAPVRVDARLELAGGLATVTGTLDLTGRVPRYDVAGRVVGINLQSMLAPPVPPVLLTGRYAVTGSGFAPATANARVRMDGSLTGWRATRGDTLALGAVVAGGSVQVSPASFRLAGANAELSGNWRFTAPVSGAVSYRVSVADLAPFGPYLPVVGDSAAAGSLRADGTVSGPLSALRFTGTLAGTGLRAGPWGAGQLSATYAIALTDSVPELDTRFQAEDVTTAGAGAYRTLTGSVRLISPALRVDVSGTEAAGGDIALVAEGTMPRSGARSVLLQRAYFDLAEGRWELQTPARVNWGGEDGVRVTNLQFRNPGTGGSIMLDGRALPLSRLEGRLAVADLPLDQVLDLLGRKRTVTGRLWADVSIRPPGTSPEIHGTFRLDQAVIEGLGLSRLEGRLDYAGGLGRTELTAAFDSAGGRLAVRGTLPLRIALTDSLVFGLADAGPVSATVVADRVSIQPLGLLVPRVRGLSGQVDGTLSLQGTVADPSLSGQLSLSGGRVTIPEVNQRFDSIGGTVSFRGRTAEIRDLRVRQGGWARVNGTVVFEELNRPVVDLAADLNGFRPMGVDEHPDAAFDGRLTLTGELNSLVMGGRVFIANGYLTVPQLATSFNPAYLEAFDPTSVPGGNVAQPRAGSWAANTRIRDLRATFGEGAWIEAFDATLQLHGNLDIEKSGDELRLTGTLQGERGTYTLAAGPIVRRFEITRSQVRFLGTAEPNPAIDITARRVVLDPDGRRVEVEVRITGTARTPSLALASADAPDIPESELLSFLLFGRRTLAFGETFATTGELVFEQTFFGGVAEVAGLELERALATNLGLQLDLFQVRFGQGFGGLTTPTFVLGRQVSNNVFLSVETGLNALFGDAGGAANTWAARLEWAISPRQTLELGYEPMNRARLFRGIGVALPPGRPSPQQLYAEYRRRWVY